MKVHEDVRGVTIRLLAEIAEIDARSILDHQRLREDLGLDSLQSLELLSGIGEALKIEFDIEDAMTIQTVRDACAFVARRYTARTGDGLP
jgi:acyl carrier protein